MRHKSHDLYEAVHKNLEKIRHDIDQHQCLLTSIMEGTVDREQLQQIARSCPYINREERMKQAIQEAIDVLEKSKQSFKSKQLEMLRKKLTQVLMENG
jgi:predicted nucleotide-binding protein (sugar kinase/HSP70/actin superfamily)